MFLLCFLLFLLVFLNGESNSLLTSKTLEKMKKETWKFILQTLAAILTAIATSLGVQSCM